jgi:hypothetical protein
LENRDLLIVVVGFILLGMGVVLLTRGEGSFFFVFPFFFAGNLAPFLMIATLFIVMMCFWWVNKKWIDDVRFYQFQEKRPTYLRVGSSCQACANPLPANAAYCSVCGNPTNQFYGDNE